VARYGGSIVPSSNLPSFVSEIKTPNGLVLAANYRPNHLHELYGDVHALSYVDLDREGLGEYKHYVQQQQQQQQLYQQPATPYAYENVSNYESQQQQPTTTLRPVSKQRVTIVDSPYIYSDPSIIAESSLHDHYNNDNNRASTILQSELFQQPSIYTQESSQYLTSNANSSFPAAQADLVSQYIQSETPNHYCTDPLANVIYEPSLPTHSSHYQAPTNLSTDNQAALEKILSQAENIDYNQIPQHLNLTYSRNSARSVQQNSTVNFANPSINNNSEFNCYSASAQFNKQKQPAFSKSMSTSSFTKRSVTKVTHHGSPLTSSTMPTLVESIFRSIDRQNNGRITIEDAEKILLRLNSRLGRRYGEDDLKAFFNALDLNLDGYLDLDEFKRAFCGLKL
jgi:hypothetical protein